MDAGRLRNRTRRRLIVPRNSFILENNDVEMDADAGVHLSILGKPRARGRVPSSEKASSQNVPAGPVRQCHWRLLPSEAVVTLRSTYPASTPFQSARNTGANACGDAFMNPTIAAERLSGLAAHSDWNRSQVSAAAQPKSRSQHCKIIRTPNKPNSINHTTPTPNTRNN